MSALESRAASLRPILIAVVLGVLIGALVGRHPGTAAVQLLSVLDALGTIFINLLKILIIPLVAASIIMAVAGLGTGGELGRLGGRTLLLYLGTTLLAVLIALAIVEAVQPGIVNGQPARDLLALESDGAGVIASVNERSTMSLADSLVAVVPSNIVAAAAGTQLLAIVLFCIVFGAALARIEHSSRVTVLSFWDGVFRTMTIMTEWVMRLAPLGVFALTARAVAKSGVNAAGPLLTFGGCVLGGLAIYAAIVVPLLVRLAGGVRPWGLFPAMAPALLTAFTTASSSATLPLSMECLEERARVSQRVARFVMPLGTSLNHAGSALYECTAALFVAQAYGVVLSFAAQLSVVLLALITSMGIASIPAASLVGLTIILTAVGLPTEAIGLLLVFDRLLDMARTAVNVLTDAACTVIVARREGETGVLDNA